MPRESTENSGVAVVILAGGEATRFPGKLESDAAGTSLLLRVFRNTCGIGPVYLSTNRSFSPELRRQLNCTFVADRSSRRGPLEGLIATFRAVTEPWVFVVAGDAPFVEAAALRSLRAAMQEGDDAIVAENPAGLIEPLCALYRRVAFLREGEEPQARGRGSVAAVAERLHCRRVRLDERTLTNINRASDLQQAFS